MKIRKVCIEDMAQWVSLSKEYDDYVLQTVPDLTQWYGGNDTSVSFHDYMRSKIDKGEAFIWEDDYGKCHGIIAISKANSRITFFGVSHQYDFFEAGNALLSYAICQMEESTSITINIIKNDATHIRKEYELLSRFGFVFVSESIENGVPVICLQRRS